MSIRLPFLLCFAALALPPAAQARDPILRIPIDCVLGQSCYIQNYVDRDPGPGLADPGCGSLTYNGHDGTDFALPDLQAMARGVAVLAATPGTVKAVRDGVIDHAQNQPGAPDITGMECGNGVVIDHGGGWESQYCHLKQGSISVAPGRRVGAGTKLGEVGLSGLTEFPHVHFSLRHEGRSVDPFDPLGEGLCRPEAKGLWQQDVGYVPAGLISAGISGQVPGFDAIKAGEAAADRLSTLSGALVVWGNVFGPQPGDVLAIRLTGPQGMVIEQELAFERGQAMAFRAGGKRGGPWPAGAYSGEVRLLRGGAEVDRREVSTILAD